MGVGGGCKLGFGLRGAALVRTIVAMRKSVLLLLLLVAGCAGKDGTWPSLARRPIEGPRPGAVAAVAAPPVQAPVVPAAIGDVPAQLATIDRDAANLDTRITEQRAATAASAAAARGTRPDSEARAKAQLDLTRLERLGSQLGDLRGRLDGIAGKLAATAEGGTDVVAPLKSTGASIIRLDAQIAEFDAAYSAASAAAAP